MATARQAFSVGYGLNIVGTYFEASELILRLGSGGSQPLREACQAQLEALVAQGASTRWYLRAVHQVLGEVGLTAPEFPETFEQYGAWLSGVSQEFYATLGDEAEIAQYLLGWYLSAWIQAANQGVIALLLLEEAPEGAVEEAVAALQEALAGAAEGLRAIVEEAPLPEKVASQAEKLLSVVQAAPPLNDPSQERLDVADDYQEALSALTEGVERLEGAL